MRIPTSILIAICLLAPLGVGAQLRGAGDGVLAGATPQHCIGGDWNDDGLTDLAVANVFDDTVHILHGRGGGSFETVQVLEVGLNPGIAGFPAVPTNLPRYLRSADINGDGFTDLVVLCSGDEAIFQFEAEPNLQVLLNLGTGLFAPWPAATVTPNATHDEFAIEFVLGKFVGDDYLDAAVACRSSRTINLLRGDGTGRFELAQTIPVALGDRGPIALAVADLTLDGRDDLVVATQRGLAWFEQIGSGSYLQRPLPVRPETYPDMNLQSVLVGDFNADGEWDVAVGDATGRIFRVEGARQATIATPVRILHSASLASPRGLAAVLWDDDATPDIAAADFQNHSVTIFCSGGSIAVVATAPQPRRLAVADIDNDGFEDLMTSNEGDLVSPANADVSFAINPGTAGSHDAPVRTRTVALDDVAGADLARPQALASRAPGMNWVLASDRRHVVLTDIPGHRLSRVDLDFVAGGIEARLDGGLYVVERFRPIIHSYGPFGDETVAARLSFALPPGGLGFTGLAHDPLAGRFFVAQPGAAAIREIDAGGNLTRTLSLSTPAWNLAWNQSLPCLLATHPGRPEIRTYLSGDPTSIPAVIPLRPATPLFRDLGPVGVSVAPGNSGITIMNNAGSWAIVDTSASLLIAGSVAPLSRVASIAYDVDADELFALGCDGLVARVGLASLSIDVLPTWPFGNSHPGFMPTGISFRHSDGRLLIGSGNSRSVATFTRTGTFLGFQEFDGVIAASLPPSQALAVDSSTGELVFRATQLLFGESNTRFHSIVAGGTTNDLCASAGRYITDLDGGALALMTRADGAAGLPIRLEPVRRVGGFSSFQEEREFARLVHGSDGLALEIYLALDPAAAMGWLDYE